ncbi:MAG TPA: aminotransferase class I/II-fold pyridoxal phosphate-dependent enzyme [Longimicrobiaceae bacterium]|nr:aminotransferase class I/II-fold pyridoxal phosphate-dependent enzyme [Longimicrobiaceae bacterium]
MSGRDPDLAPETRAIRIQTERTPQREHSVPLYLTSSFVFDSAEQARALFADEIDGNVYSRYSNPNADELTRKLAAMEGTEDGIATASGMAAVFATFAALLASGDHLVAGRALFGSTHQLLTRVLPRWGIGHTYVDMDATPEEIGAAIRPETKLVFVETPSNPGLALIDLQAVSRVCRERGVLLVVDNCFTTPYLQQPVSLGADLVIHSATKFIDGQGRTLGGAILGPAEVINEIRFFTRHTGPSISPFNAWILSKSLETLGVRMDRHCENALRLAERLEANPDVERVLYPFLPSHPQYELARRQMSAGGGIVAIFVRGGLERASRFIDSLELLSHSPNLGDTRTIVTHPTSTTHSKLTEEERQRVGITPGLVRISVGLESLEDILHDIEQALETSR